MKKDRRRRSTIKSGDQRFSLVVIDNSVDVGSTEPSRQSTRSQTAKLSIISARLIALLVVMILIIMFALISYYLIMLRDNKFKSDEESARLFKKNCSTQIPSPAQKTMIKTDEYLIVNSGFYFGHVTIWRWETCELVLDLRNDDHIVGVYENTILTGGQGFIRQRDLNNFEIQRTLPCDFAVLRADTSELFCRHNLTIVLHEFLTFDIVRELEQVPELVRKMFYNKAMPDVIVGFADDKLSHLYVWNTTSGQMIRKINTYKLPIMHMSLDERGVFYGGRGFNWLAWNVTDGRLVLNDTKKSYTTIGLTVDLEAGKIAELGTLSRLCIRNLADAKVIRCYCFPHEHPIEFGHAISKEPTSNDLIVISGRFTYLLDSKLLYSNRLDARYAVCSR